MSFIVAISYSQYKMTFHMTDGFNSNALALTVQFRTPDTYDSKENRINLNWGKWNLRLASRMTLLLKWLCLPDLYTVLYSRKSLLSSGTSMKLFSVWIPAELVLSDRQVLLPIEPPVDR
jgi:hypothetical protein